MAVKKVVLLSSRSKGYRAIRLIITVPSKGKEYMAFLLELNLKLKGTYILRNSLAVIEECVSKKELYLLFFIL